MLIGKPLSKHYRERHIDVKNIMAGVPCSQKLKDILAKVTAFDPPDRYMLGETLMAALDKCPEFRGMKRLPIPQSVQGTVRGYDIASVADDIFTTTQETSGKSISKVADPFRTMLLSDAFFYSDNTETVFNVREDERREVYLIRQSNNERIVLDQAIFRVGRNKTKVNYCLSDIHIEISQKNGSFYVKDMNSTNGTYINSVRVRSGEEYKLAHGDQIRIASEVFVFNISDKM